jgi:hypothetical protein
MFMRMPCVLHSSGPQAQPQSAVCCAGVSAYPRRMKWEWTKLRYLDKLGRKPWYV